MKTLRMLDYGWSSSGFEIQAFFYGGEWNIAPLGIRRREEVQTTLVSMMVQ
jgi:hypothetical protein